jgi:hypothetical protein
MKFGQNFMADFDDLKKWAEHHPKALALPRW